MGWLTYKLGDICDFQGGSQPPKSVFIQEEKDGYIRLLQIRDFKSDDKAIYIPEAKKNRICKNDDVMLARYGASVGQVHRGKSGAYNVALIKTIPNTDIIDKDFLYLYLHSESFQKRLVSVAERSAQAGFSKADISPFEVSVPSIPEQKRIVAILDEAFAEIEKARAKTEQNLKNARELFESYLQQVFSQRGEGWVGTELFDHVNFIDYRGKTPKKTEHGLRLITAKNVRMGYLKTEPQEFVAPESYDDWMTRGIPKKGDVLFTTEAPLANVAQLDTDDKTVFAQRIITMQPDPNVINSTFLKYMLMSQPIQQLIHDKGTGATCTGIKASLLKKIPITYPSTISEQVKYVDVLDSLIESTKVLENIYFKKLSALDELKKSILQKAFSGELTAKDVA